MLNMENYQGTTDYNLLEDTDIVNSLSSSDTNKALSAAQGKVLIDRLNAIKIKSINNVLIAAGTIKLNIPNRAYAILFTGEQIKEMLGLSSYTYKNVVAFVTNGDASLLGQKIDATYMSTDGSLSITLATNAAGNFAINYAIIYKLN